MDEIETTPLTSFTVEWPKIRRYYDGMITLMELNPDKYEIIFEFFCKIYPQHKEGKSEAYQKYLEEQK